LFVVSRGAWSFAADGVEVGTEVRYLLDVRADSFSGPLIAVFARNFEGLPGRKSMKKLKVLCVAILVMGLASSAKAQLEFGTTTLVTSSSGASAPTLSDSTAINLWGIALSGSSPFWVSNEGSGIANLYTVDAATGGTVSKNATTMPTIPGNGSVTGEVSNGNTAAFSGAHFLFVSQDGTVSSWSSGAAAVALVPASTANAYFWAAESTSGTNSYLYAANFKAGAINVFPGTVTTPSLTGSFTDPTGGSLALPAGYAPYNIQSLGGNLFVTYALQNSGSSAAVKATGNGYVDEYDTQGDFLGRIASNGSLNAPWGLALAPADFGPLAGDLLVGNFGGGNINAYNLSTDSLDGQLLGTNGQPLAINGLWALTPGNNGSGGSSQTIYFTAGPNNQTAGQFGEIAPTPEPSTLVLLGVGAVGLLAYRWRRRRE
jgi:uncharacterized protein (TIGR03118 family)